MNKESKLKSLVEKAVNGKDILGIQLRLESGDGNVIQSAAAGNMQTETPFYIASINKIMISALALRLCYQGSIHLSDKISKYLPSALISGIHIWKGREYSWEITVQQLMSHTSGIPCYLLKKQANGRRGMDDLLAGKNEAWPLERVVREVKQMKPHFAPGNGKAAYGETNFRLLGRILEIVTRKSISDLLTEMFDELNMRDTFVLPKNQSFKPVIRHGKEIPLEAYWRSTGHDIVSTARDQITFLRAFIKGYFSPETMLNYDKGFLPIFFPLHYGLGVQKFSIPRWLSPFEAQPTFYGHCGSVGSIAFYVPEHDVYISGTINSAGKPRVIFRIMLKALRLFNSKYSFGPRVEN
ncbi:MAG: beta-lactamase family protein [Cryomorphaceae bacterium]|nr:beta-lactamase family protein [Cryomorphaceae bacterium]